MIRHENDCVGCPSGLGCIGSACPYRDVVVFVCDECEGEVDELYEYADGRQLCADCLLEQYKKITYDTYREYEEV